MSPHPFETKCKAILNDPKFSLGELVNTGINQFFIDMLLYVNSFSEQKSLFKRNRFPDTQLLINVMEKIIPLIKPGSLQSASFPSLKLLFSCFLHPETSENIRKSSISLLLQILITLQKYDLEELFPCFDIMVPFSCFASEGEEKQAFMELIQNIRPIHLSSHSPPTTNDTIEDIQMIVSFCIDNWSKTPDLCFYILFEKIFFPIYRKAVEEAKFPSPKFTFNGKLIIPLHYQVISFFQQVYENDIIMTYIFDKINSVIFTICVLEENASLHNKKHQILSLTILINMLIKKYSEHIFKMGSDLIKRIGIAGGNLIQSFFPSKENGSEVKSIDSKLLSNFVECIVTTLRNPEFVEPKEGIKILENFLTYFLNIKFTYAYFFIGILCQLIDTQNISEDYQKFIVWAISRHPFAGAIYSYFLQFLLASFWTIWFNIPDENNTINDLCNQYIRRKARTKQFTKADFIAQNINALLSSPDDFTRTKFRPHFFKNSIFLNSGDSSEDQSKIPITRYYQDFISSDDEKILQMVSIYSLYINSMKNKDRSELYTLLKELVNKELDILICLSQNERRKIFYPILIFSDSCILFSQAPPSLKLDTKLPLILNAKRLINAIIRQNDDFLIQLCSFRILSTMINQSEMLPFLSAENLLDWYACLSILMLSKDKSVMEEAFSQAVCTIMHGFIGSEILIPLMMNIIEQGNISISSSVIGFLSSFPLFESKSFESIENFKHAESGQKCNIEQFFTLLSELIQNSKSNYLDNSIDLLSLQPFTTNMKERAINNILNYCDINNNKWDILLPGLSAIILNEIHSNEVSDNLSKAFNNIIVAVSNHIPESLKTISSLSTYSSFFLSHKDFAEQFSQLIQKFSSLTVELLPTDDEEWIFQSLSTLSYFYVLSSNIIINAEHYHSFIHFLHQVSLDDSKFTSRIQQNAYNLLSFLTIMHMNYPFPYGSVFPSNTHSFNHSDSVTSYYSSCNSLFLITKREENVSISTLNSVGHFIWNFIENKIQIPQEERQPFDIPINEDQSIIPEPYSNSDQKEFADIFSKIEQNMPEQDNSEEILDLPPDEASTAIFNNAPISTNRSTIKTYTDKNFSIISNLPQVIEPTNIPAAVLQASGKISILDGLKASSSDEFNILESLNRSERSNYRLCEKIGVVYVAPNAENQNAILETTWDDTSSNFKEFVYALGWPINIETHLGYDGGLIKGGKNGETIVYTADVANEVVFHISPLLPTDPTDPQQLMKKRHIGNDHIHIVWCEDPKDYNVATITSQFNYAHIIIYPLQTGLFRVDIKWRSELPWFGPLRFPTIVSKKMLPSLVRETAIQAMRVFYDTQPAYVYPQEELRRITDGVVSSMNPNKTNTGFSALVSIMTTNHDGN